MYNNDYLIYIEGIQVFRISGADCTGATYTRLKKAGLQVDIADAQTGVILNDE